MVTMTLPKGEEKLRRVLTDEQLKALFKTCATKSFVDLRDLAIMRLFLDSGMRLNELRMLKLEDLQMKNFCTVVRGKGAKWRYCVFGAKTAQALDRYLRVRSQHPHSTSEYLWIGQRGHITVDLIQKMLFERGEKAGIAHMHPHLLRHSFIDRMKRSGMSEENIMQLTGHSSTEVVLHYAKSLRAERAMEDYKSRAPGDKI
jgi:site-specific recombinase XerD